MLTYFAGYSWRSRYDDFNIIFVIDDSIVVLTIPEYYNAPVLHNFHEGQKS